MAGQKWRGYSKGVATETAAIWSERFPQHVYWVLRNPETAEGFGYLVRHDPEEVFNGYERHGAYQGGVRLETARTEEERA